MAVCLIVGGAAIVVVGMVVVVDMTENVDKRSEFNELFNGFEGRYYLEIMQLPPCYSHLPYLLDKVFYTSSLTEMNGSQ